MIIKIIISLLCLLFVVAQLQTNYKGAMATYTRALYLWEDCLKKEFYDRYKEDCNMLTGAPTPFIVHWIKVTIHNTSKQVITYILI